MFQNKGSRDELPNLTRLLHNTASYAGYNLLVIQMFYGPGPSLFAVHAPLNWSAALPNETTSFEKYSANIFHVWFSDNIA